MRNLMCSAAAGVGMLLFAMAGDCRAQASRFVIIGDQGRDNANQAAIANRLKTYNPEFLITVGDNTYYTASVADWDRTNGKYFGEFIKYPAGSTSQYADNGVTVNNYFPTLGNHDWTAGVASYTDYFELPGNERYYSFVRGDVEFFVLSSDPSEPDGRSPGSTQYNWAQSAIQNSTAEWQLVFFHHPAYTYPGSYAPTTEMRWPFLAWGVDAVFSGHVHNMQRMDADGLPYYITGASGGNLANGTAYPSGATGLFMNDTSLGFMLVDVGAQSLTLRFIDNNGTVLDTSVIPEPAACWIVAAAALMKRQPR